MTWSTRSDLRAQVERLWDRGDLLRAVVTESVKQPVRLHLKTPSTADLTDRFDEVRAWVRDIQEVPHLHFEWEDRNHRVQGIQRLPSSAWIGGAQEAMVFIGKSQEAQRFAELWLLTSGKQPALLGWISKRPLQAVSLADRWERLLEVVAWVQARPRPDVYIRQVDALGVDSKFIESHRGVLAELLDAALPAETIDQGVSGVSQFAQRFGFKDKPARVRFRLLDTQIPLLPRSQSDQPGCPDVTLDAGSFAALTLPVDRVLITENETNFLAFPPVRGAIVIFGSGYGWEALSRASWLQQARLYYWGDIDTHGFAILDQLRGYFPQVSSLLMDRETLIAHRLHWGEEPEPVHHDLHRLTSIESLVYDDLRFDRIQPRLRLEQERIGYAWLCGRLPS